MNERYLVLERSIQADLGMIARLYEALGETDLKGAEPQEVLIVIAYRLHSLYSAFENIFRNIATAFENQLDPVGWDRQLLQRMRLDLLPIRPAVIDDKAYGSLDEMLRFRHVFLTMYGIELDASRLQVALQKTLALKPLYQPQIEKFLEFLRSL